MNKNIKVIIIIILLTAIAVALFFFRVYTVRKNLINERLGTYKQEAVENISSTSEKIDVIKNTETGELQNKATSSKPETAQTAEINEFKNKANWEAFDAGNIGGLITKGYFGATFDGRYVYYAPCRTAKFHGVVLRYDTQKGFALASSWQSYNAGSVDGLDTRGYAGAVFDGRYVYYVPFSVETTRHARVLRFDTQGSFTSSDSWSAYDAKAVGAGFGYDGAVIKGQYIYFTPFGYEPFAHAKVLRFDTQGGFKDPSSWKVYDASLTNGLNTKGYYGTVLAGDYIYFVPFNDGQGFHGRVLRYDTRKSFEDSSSWSAYDASSTGGKNTVGYKGAIYDGKYIYFVPFRGKEESHGLVLRYNTEKDFKTSSSWDVYDAEGTDGLDTRGYVGGEFDGRYIYLIPYSYEESQFHAKALRYDTQGDFKSKASWSAYDAGVTSGLVTKGYKYSVSDGKYIYYVPYNNGKTFSGIALRYKIK